jgi:hypothetical protein
MARIAGFTVNLSNAGLVHETTQTTGTGTYSLDGAASGKRTFVAGFGSGQLAYYTCRLGSQYEEGLGTVTSGAPSTLTRSTILASSNSGNAVSWGAGIKDIYVDLMGAAANLIFPSTSVVGGIKLTVFTANGTYTRDANCIFARVRMVGGGGGGGSTGGTAGGEAAEGGGGGGGEYAEHVFTATTLGASKTVTIGIGGVSTNGATSDSGGTTSLGTLLTAVGGGGGNRGSGTTGNDTTGSGAGGTGGTGGGLHIQGGYGGLGTVRAGIRNSTNHGGMSLLGATRVDPSGGTGAAGKNYGSGGTGSSKGANLGSSHLGGDGAPGVIIVEEFLFP